jgi:hypothetical protein
MSCLLNVWRAMMTRTPNSFDKCGLLLRDMYFRSLRPAASSETLSVIRFERPNSLTDEVHHAIRDAVHRTSDLD